VSCFWQAGRCLGEIVAKLGERVTSSIVPVLENGLHAEDPARRQGVCFGLGEVIRALPQRNGEGFLPQLTPPILLALCDSNDGVRDAAAQAFRHLFRLSGQMAITTIVQDLLRTLDKSGGNDNSDDEHSPSAVKGLSAVVSALPTVVLKYLVPIVSDTSESTLSWAQSLAIKAIVRSNAVVDGFFNSIFNSLFRSIATLVRLRLASRVWCSPCAGVLLCLCCCLSLGDCSGW